MMLLLLMSLQWPLDTLAVEVTTKHIVVEKSLGQERLFLIDQHMETAMRIDVSTRKRTTFAKPGQGPGQLQKPREIRCMGDRLYIYDQTGVDSFDLEGRFLDTFHPPERVAFMEKAKHGWVGLANVTHNQGEPLKLWWFDDEVTLAEEVFSLPAPANYADKKHNPVVSLAQLHVSASGERCFLKPQDGAEVLVFNVTTREKRTLSIPGKPVPYDPTYPQKLATLTGRPLLSGAQLYVPDSFPLIHHIDHFGEFLVVRKWPPIILTQPPVEKLMKQGLHVALSPKGQPMKVSVGMAFPNHVIQESDQVTFLLTKQETGTTWVYRAPPIEAMHMISQTYPGVRVGFPE